MFLNLQSECTHVGMLYFSSLGSKNEGQITAFGGHAPFLVDEYGHIRKVYPESLNGFSLKCFINMNAFKKRHLSHEQKFF